MLCRKWLFKQENTSLWSLAATPGWPQLKTKCVGADSPCGGECTQETAAANLLLQRPSAAYHTIETRMRWVGPCTKSGHGGIISRELNSGSGCAAGLVCKDGQLSVTVWQDTFFQLAPGNKNITGTEVYIRCWMVNPSSTLSCSTSGPGTLSMESTGTGSGATVCIRTQK